jgi:hypothetical protein
MRRRLLTAFFIFFITTAGVFGQSSAVVSPQVGKSSIDFSGATLVKPWPLGASLPATCSVGQAFWLSTATAGQNWYGCTAPNVWTQEGGSGGGGSNFLVNGSPLISSTTLNFVNSSASNGLTLTFNNPSSGNIQLGLSGQLSNSGLLNPSLTINSTVCTLGSSCMVAASSLFTSYQFGNQTAITGSSNYIQTTYPSIFTTSQTGTGTSGSPFIDAIGLTAQNANLFFAGPPSGGATSPAFRPIAGVDLPSSVVQTGQSNSFLTGTQSAANASHTTPAIVVATSGALPGTCSTGELAFVTGSTAGQQIWECSSPNTWTQQGGGSGGGIVVTTTCTTTGTAPAFACTASPAISSLTIPNNVSIVLVLNANSAGSDTVNVTGLGVKALVTNDGTGMVANQLQAAQPYLFSYDGSVFRQSYPYPVPGATGCMTQAKGANPPTYDFVVGCLLTQAFAWTGYHNFSGGAIRLPESTIAGLPAASTNTGKEFIVTDGASASDCTTGGGSTVVNMCRSNGTIWVQIGGGGASGPHKVVYQYSATATTPVTCNGSAQMLDQTTITGGTLAVGDVIQVNVTYLKTGTTGTAQYGMSLSANISPGAKTPPSAISTNATDSAASQTQTFQVAGSSSEIASPGTFFRQNGVLNLIYGGLETDGTLAIASDIHVGPYQTCTASDSGSVNWTLIVTR